MFVGVIPVRAGQVDLGNSILVRPFTALDRPIRDVVGILARIFVRRNDDNRHVCALAGSAVANNPVIAKTHITVCWAKRGCVLMGVSSSSTETERANVDAVRRECRLVGRTGPAVSERTAVC